MANPQPTLEELLVRHVRLPRESLPQIGINSLAYKIARKCPLPYPVSIEVFPGNTHDPHTLAAQLAKVKTRFGVTEITFVGDRGMIKGQQVEDLTTQGCHYITAITKPQIEKLLRTGVLQMGLVEHE